ncbi:MAG: flavoprotein, partial [Melioribacteraceae bacterium]
MSKYKILFGITGSIAAYKSAYLISKLLQNDFEVK